MAEEPKRDSLEERLMENADSFGALLSLMPADVYFGKDTNDQWQRKKQTKEQKRAAKRAKLDPDNAKTAKDVLDEQAAEFRKRKREEGGEEGAPTVEEGESHDLQTSPTQAYPDDGEKSKKQKRESGDVSKAKNVEQSTTQDESAQDLARAAKAREKKLRKKAKAEKKSAKLEAKKKRKEQKNALAEDSKAAAIEQNQSAPVQPEQEAEIALDESDREGEEAEALEMDNPFAADDFIATASPSPETELSTFDPPHQDSGSSSISSIVPPPTDKTPSLPRIDTSDNKDIVADSNLTANSNSSNQDSKLEGLKARLAARIEALRTARKAADPSLGPTNRQELIESRRRKEEERKAHKKALRRKAREDEEAANRSESLARSSPLLSNTNSPLLSPGSPATSTEHNNFSFSRISFPNGQRASASLDAILTPHSKPKGPSDPKTALLAATNRKSRLAALDPDKQADIAEKDTWLNASKRAHGERIRDDTSLLKKTLKRKEKQKKKSEKEWKERLEGVEKGKEMRQKKREGNLRKRREEKGGKGASKAKGGGKKKKARPGFEGSFKTKAPSAGNGGGVAMKPRRR